MDDRFKGPSQQCRPQHRRLLKTDPVNLHRWTLRENRETNQHPLPRAQVLSRVRLFVTPWTVAHQALLSTGSSRQEYWTGLPCLLSRDLSDPGIEPTSPALANGFFPTAPPGKPFAWTDIQSSRFKLEYFILKKLVSPQARSSMEQRRQETPRPAIPPATTDVCGIGGCAKQLLARSHSRLTTWRFVPVPPVRKHKLTINLKM